MVDRRLTWGAAVVSLLVSMVFPRPVPPPLVDDTPDGYSRWGFPPVPSAVLLVGFAPLRAVGPATLESVTLEQGSGELEILAARVSLLDCQRCRKRSDAIGVRGYAGSWCSTGPWPPPGYGPTYPLAGFTVDGHDRVSDLVSVVVYLRAKTTLAHTRGAVLRYRDRSGALRAVRINEEIEVHPPRDDRPLTCPDSQWFESPDLARGRPSS